MLLPIVFPFGILDLRFFLTTREAEIASHICLTCLTSPQFASLGTFYPILVPDSLLACLCFSRSVFVFLFFSSFFVYRNTLFVSFSDWEKKHLFAIEVIGKQTVVEVNSLLGFVHTIIWSFRRSPLPRVQPAA